MWVLNKITWLSSNTDTIALLLLLDSLYYKKVTLLKNTFHLIMIDKWQARYASVIVLVTARLFPFVLAGEESYLIMI